MSNHFRLLRASIPAKGIEQPVPVHIAHRGMETESWTSVLIGRNGVGKSRLLAGIASGFAALADNDRPAREQTSFEYEYGRDLFRVDATKKEPKCFRNGEPVHLAGMALPSRVVAVTTAPFDKFQLPKRMYSSHAVAQNPIYRYMGLRDFTGRASATGAVYRALGELFGAAASEDRRRDRIAGVFGYLGYRPNVDVTYRWTNRGQQLARDVESSDAKTLYNALMPGGPYNISSALARIVREDPEIFARIVDVVERVKGLHGGPRFVLSANFEDREGAEPELFQDLQLLRKADLVDVTGVLLFREADDIPIDLREVSSGELAIVTSFLGIASAIDDSSLVIIDEPEISLHPEWQTQYLERLRQTFASYRNCHFLIATHSPLIVSDMTSNASNIVSIDPTRREPEIVQGRPGRSTDQVLLEEFDVVGADNLFLRQLVVRALRLATDLKVESAEFEQTMTQLNRVYPLLPDQDPTRLLIEQLAEAARMATA